MAANFVGGLAQGFGQGLKFGEQIKEGRRDRNLRQGLDEIYSEKAPNEGLSPQELEINRLRQSRPLYAKYDPNQLPTINSQIANAEGQSLRRDVYEQRMAQRQEEMNRQAAVNDYFNDLDPERLSTDPLGTALEVAQLSGDPDALFRVAGDQGELVAENAAMEFMGATDQDMVNLYSGVRDNHSAEIVDVGDGVRQMQVFDDANPGQPVQTFNYASDEELRQQLTPRLAEANPMIGNNVMRLQAERAEQRANSGVELNASMYQAIDEQAMRFEDQLVAESGMSRDQMEPDMLAGIQQQAQQAAINRVRSTQAGLSGRGMTSGGGQNPGAGGVLDPSSPQAQAMRELLGDIGAPEESSAPGSEPAPRARPGGGLPPRMQYGP